MGEGTGHEGSDAHAAASGADVAGHLERLRHSYRKRLPEKIRAIRAAFDTWANSPHADFARRELVGLLHNLAGSGATFGYPKLGEAARVFGRALADASLKGSSDPRSSAIQALMDGLEEEATKLETTELQGRRASAARSPMPGRMVGAGRDAPIFLVEDDADLAAELSDALATRGYDVRVFPRLDGLVAAVSRTPPLAVVMDLILPEGELAGLAAVTSFNGSREVPIPVVAISVREDMDARLAAIRAGCTRYLAKPFPPDTLAHELDELTISRPPEPYRVLVVDDDPILAEAFRCALTEAAMHVTVETHPREALTALTESRAELVLMDIHMPYCSGIELAMVIRQHDRFADVPIVFLSTEADLDKRLAAMHLGGDDFLSKPIEGWHLARAVHARVRRARARRVTKERLLQSRDAAEQSSRAKSEFLALMSHELRTPMNGILGMTELASEEAAGPKQRHYLSLLRTSAESLLRILNDILDYSKIEAGKLGLCPAPFSVESCLSSALEPIALAASAKGLRFKVSVEQDVPPVLIGDAQRLGQILMNLASNAVKFTEKGSVDVNVACTPQPAGLETSLLFSVTDTGIGISADQMGRVFGVFEQGDQSTTRRYGGTGLGLAICEKLARIMGGSVRAESTLGKGTTFLLRVPFEVGALVDSPLAPTSPRPALPRYRGRILVAEDNEVNRVVVGAMLENEGFEVRFARDGQEAIEALKRNAFDVVLMDVLMPNLDGIQATQEIRRDESGTNRHVPIVALTALAMSGDREMLLARGLDGYLSKPVRGNDLLCEIQRLLPDSMSPFVDAVPARHTQNEGGAATSLLDRQELLMRCGDDEAMVAQVLSMVRERAPVLLECCRSALAAGDAAELRARAHEFSGMVANLSTAVAAEARALQRLAAAGTLDDAEDALLRLERLMGELVSEF